VVEILERVQPQFVQSGQIHLDKWNDAPWAALAEKGMRGQRQENAMKKSQPDSPGVVSSAARAPSAGTASAGPARARP
jgi:hypothetical protein